MVDAKITGLFCKRALQNRRYSAKETCSFMEPTDRSHPITLTYTGYVDTCYTATHCNTLQHTATHCNTLQHTATHCNTLQHTANTGYVDTCYTARRVSKYIHLF